MPSILYVAAFLFLNLLFAIKYGVRVGTNPWASGFLYALFFAGQLVAGGAVAVWAVRRRQAGFWLWALLVVYLAVAFVLYRSMDPYALAVDRHTALEAFFGALFRGEFPWAVKSHLGTNVSVFPGMQVLAMPFYLLGDVGLLQFAALVAFVALLVVRSRESGRPFFLLGVLLAMPAFQYQVFVRSDLWGNAVAIAWLMHFSLKPGISAGGKLYAWAVLWGLALATRAIFVIPFIFVAWRLVDGRGSKATVLFGLTVAATFVLTFLPFYVWDPVLFWARNPYYVQSGYVTREVLVLVLASTIVVGFLRRRSPPATAFAHAGATLFLTVFICWVVKSMQEGWTVTLWHHYFDVTYFTLCLPFLVIAWGDALISRDHAGRERGQA